MPGVVLAGGSQQTAAIGAAVIAAHIANSWTDLLKLAGNDSPLAGLTPDEVGREWTVALAHKLDDPMRRHESYVLHPRTRANSAARSRSSGENAPHADSS